MDSAIDIDSLIDQLLKKEKKENETVCPSLTTVVPLVPSDEDNLSGGGRRSTYKRITYATIATPHVKCLYLRCCLLYQQNKPQNDDKVTTAVLHCFAVNHGP